MLSCWTAIAFSPRGGRGSSFLSRLSGCRRRPRPTAPCAAQEYLIAGSIAVRNARSVAVSCCAAPCPLVAGLHGLSAMRRLFPLCLVIPGRRRRALARMGALPALRSCKARRCASHALMRAGTTGRGVANMHRADREGQDPVSNLQGLVLNTTRLSPLHPRNLQGTHP